MMPCSLLQRFFAILGKFNTHTYMYIYPSGQVLNMNKTIKKDGK